MMQKVEGGTTYCLSCREALIVRDWCQITACDITPQGTCPHCAMPIARAFEAFHGQFGRRRIPLAINRR
jgi:pyruvate formate lyase activating enzyme